MPTSPPGKIALSLKAVADKVVTYFNTKSSTIFDINEVAITLNVPKRRLYDVLNIMAPMGLVGRNGRGKYIWTGSMQPSFGPAQKEEKSDNFDQDLSSNDKNILSANLIPPLFFTQGVKDPLQQDDLMDNIAQLEKK